jgi:hypothetical protein
MKTVIYPDIKWLEFITDVLFYVSWTLQFLNY